MRHVPVSQALLWELKNIENVAMDKQLSWAFISVRVRMCVYVCVCVCVREREREMNY